jgi:hypothetical protein
MRTVSFEKYALNITIHNLHQDIELTSPVYFSNGTACHVSPSQRMDTGNTMEAVFGMYSKQKDFKGALLYKLQRKHATKIDNDPNNDTAFNEDMKTNIYLLMVWDIENYNHGFHVCLIECTDDFTWDEDKLLALYEEYSDQFCVDYAFNIVTWLIHGDTVLKIRRDVIYGSDYKLDIIISKGTGGYDLEKPIEVDIKRSVLLLSMLIVLICAVRLDIWPSVKLDIHNQCLNIDLVSPTYIVSHRSECHRLPDYKVCVGNKMRSGFIIKSGNGSDGALIYRLQRKQTHKSIEIGKDTPSATHLLVVWEFSGSEELYADVLLVEHDNEFDWNKDNLKSLYRKNFGLFKWFTDSAIETWSLDNVTLMITFEIMNECHLLNIIISEIEKYNGARTPVRIDLNG